MYWAMLSWVRASVTRTELSTLNPDSGGRYPASHSAEQGPSDLHAMLRGHNQALVDLMDDPQKTASLLENLGRFFAQVTEEVWSVLPKWEGGYFDAQ